VFNHTPKQAGLLMTPMVAGIPLGSIINGRLYPRQNEPRRLMLLGGILMASGCLGTLLLSASSSDWLVLISLGLAGLGLGFLLPNFTLGAQVLSATQDIGVASGLIQTTRALGSAIGMAATGLFIAKISISGGLRISLAIALALSILTIWMVSQVQMRNVSTR
jgi:MFS family permease